MPTTSPATPAEANDACADLAGVGERHEHYGERDDDNQDDGDAVE